MGHRHVWLGHNWKRMDFSGLLYVRRLPTSTRNKSCSFAIRGSRQTDININPPSFGLLFLTQPKGILMGTHNHDVVDDQESTLGEEEEELDMDANVWSNLPDELLAIVLAHLPRSCNLRLRRVCKFWNSILGDSELLSRYCPATCADVDFPRLMCFVVGNATHCAIFNLSVRKWYPMLHSSLLPGLPSAEDYQIVAASSGVFLMEGKFEELGRFLVNPLNKTRRELPPLPSPDLGYRSTCTILDMVVDRNSGVHKIIAEQTEYEEPESPSGDDPLGTTKFSGIYVYDFKRTPCCWEMVTTLQSEIDLCLEVESAVLVGDALYVLLVQPFGWCWMYRVFRTLSTDWKELHAEMIYDMGHVHLFAHRGQLMLVGGTDVLKSDEPLSVGIWQFDSLKEEWDHVLSMPDELVRKLCAVPDNGMFYHFDVEDDCACFINPFTEITVTCDLVKNVWDSVDRLEHGNNFQQVDDLVFMFRPRLDVVF